MLQHQTSAAAAAAPAAAAVTQNTSPHQPTNWRPSQSRSACQVNSGGEYKSSRVSNISASSVLLVVFERENIIYLLVALFSIQDSFKLLQRLKIWTACSATRGKNLLSLFLLTNSLKRSKPVCFLDQLTALISSQQQTECDTPNRFAPEPARVAQHPVVMATRGVTRTTTTSGWSSWERQALARRPSYRASCGMNSPSVIAPRSRSYTGVNMRYIHAFCLTGEDCI